MQFIRIMHFGCGISLSAVLSESSIFSSIGISSIISTVEFVRSLEYIFIVPVKSVKYTYNPGANICNQIMASQPQQQIVTA